mgnify:CR=1 FL=1
MTNEILASHEERMKKSIEALKHEFASLRAGRATPSLLDKVMVNYYGAPTLSTRWPKSRCRNHV